MSKEIVNKIPKQGEIWITDFNRKRERENFKIRPVLIMSNNWQNQHDKYAVVAPLTSDEEELKKDIKKASLRKFSKGNWTSEINCRQEDIGEPTYRRKKGKK